MLSLIISINYFVFFKPREILQIKENVRDAVVTDQIIATDPDTTANLTLQIDWKNTYASKPGFDVEREFYEG